jgi:hypothetical protein
MNILYLLMISHKLYHITPVGATYVRADGQRLCRIFYD